MAVGGCAVFVSFGCPSLEAKLLFSKALALTCGDLNLYSYAVIKVPLNTDVLTSSVLFSYGR